MPRTIISEGKTTNEAIEKGLKELKVAKNMVDIKVIESEGKRSFFDILAPRVVKVELTVKEGLERNRESITQVRENKEERKIDVTELENAKSRVENFIMNFIKNVSNDQLDYGVEIANQNIEVIINGVQSGFLIGYRGDVLNSLQTILSAIANHNTNSKIKVILDIEGYRNKRKQTLENLAVKVSKTVSKTGKSITLEPMGAYERKIIHTKLQDSKYVTTYSVGEEPNRRVVIEKK